MYTRLMWCLLGLSLSLSVFSTGCSGDASGILGNAGDDISADAPNTPHGDGILGDASTPVKDVTSALDVTEDSAALPGEMGFPCAGNEDCFSGYCIPGPDGPVCTKACEDDCPMGWSCNSVNGGGDVTYICVPNFLNLCRPCHTTADCSMTGFGQIDSNDLCIQIGDEGTFCGRDCTTAGCPDGYNCADIPMADESVARQCVPDDGICECNAWAVASEATTPCDLVGALGTCQGVRSCASGSLSACEGEGASPESCDSYDNDCDGIIDEDSAVNAQTWYADVQVRGVIRMMEEEKHLFQSRNYL